MSKVPRRIELAVARLMVQPGDRILEIGCGPGHAIALIRTIEPFAEIVGIDRSPIMIGRAEANNHEALASGTVSLREVSVAEAVFPPAAFDKIFAVNVNFFWLRGAREIEILKRALAPHGRLWVFYEAPSADRSRAMADPVASNLVDGGFEIEQIEETGRSPGPFLAVRARLRSPEG